MSGFLFRHIVRPLLFKLPPETAHNLALWFLKNNHLPSIKQKHYSELNHVVSDLFFSHPIGMAAGFDKNAIAVKGLFKQSLSFVEVGTVTPLPQKGNPKPRLFRLTKEASILNRMGFNNDGMEACAKSLEKYYMLTKDTSKKKHIIGVNLGKNKDSVDPVEDYCKGLARLGPLSDYIVINISSPNTQGLRDLQQKNALDTLLKALIATRDGISSENQKKIPLWLKLAPDLSRQEQEDIAETVMAHKIDALILTNTTIQREKVPALYSKESGGVSGALLKPYAHQSLHQFYRLIQGKIPIIGVGGIDSGEEAYARIKAGASLLQIYTGFVYQGMGLVEEIKRDLSHFLKRDGFTSISQAIGIDHK